MEASEYRQWIDSLNVGDRLAVSSGRKFYEGKVMKITKTTIVVNYRQSGAQSFRRRDGFQTGDNSFPLFIKPLTAAEEEVIQVTKLENRYRNLVEEIGIPQTLPRLNIAIGRLEELKKELTESL